MGVAVAGLAGHPPPVHAGLPGAGQLPSPPLHPHPHPRHHARTPRPPPSLDHHGSYHYHHHGRNLHKLDLPFLLRGPAHCHRLPRYGRPPARPLDRAVAQRLAVLPGRQPRGYEAAAGGRGYLRDCLRHTAEGPTRTEQIATRSDIVVVIYTGSQHSISDSFNYIHFFLPSLEVFHFNPNP